MGGCGRWWEVAGDCERSWEVTGDRGGLREIAGDCGGLQEIVGDHGGGFSGSGWNFCPRDGPWEVRGAPMGMGVGGMGQGGAGNVIVG